MEKEILGKSENGYNGQLLPMKQSPEQEAEKSIRQKNNELCNFVKNAFCVDGEVLLVKSEKPIKFNLYFAVKDREKGNYYVAFNK